MGKKNLPNKNEKAMLKHEQDDEVRRLQENIVAHPLKGRDSAWVDDYVRGQLMLRKVGKTLDKKGMLLRSFAVNLGISLEHLAELEMEVSKYDEQSMENFGIDCLKCQITQTMSPVSCLTWLVCMGRHTLSRGSFLICGAMFA